MNIILFTENELNKPLSADDPRYQHIINILKCKEGDTIDIGVINGPRGKATVKTLNKNKITLSYVHKDNTPELYPVILLAGIVRPNSMQRIIKDVTSLGVSRIIFTGTDKGEKSYLKSRLLAKNEYTKHLISGAQQAFCTRLPIVKICVNLELAVKSLPKKADKIALDNYEAAVSLNKYKINSSSCVLAAGSERGWSDKERNVLRANSFTIADIGKRVLKTETACIAGVTLCLSKMGYM